VADQYIYTGSYPTVQVTGPTTAVDVLRISASTIPSQVAFTFNAPYRGLVGINVKGDAPTPAQAVAVADRFAAPIAAGIERMMGIGIVAGAAPTEDADASGLIIDYIDAVVEYLPDNLRQGEFTATVRIPTNAFDEPSFFGPLVATPIGAAYEALKALAAA
jgi:hypothetical protein